MKRLTYHQFAMLTPDEIGKLNKKEMVDLLKDARKKLDTRLKTFSKQGKNFYSPAQEKIREYYEENPQQSINKVSRNRALNEIFNIQDFFRSKTGTVKGAKEVMREQDARIFGVNEKSGRPLHRLTTDQRTAFWQVYNEFTSQYKTAIAAFTSGKIQQYLGERVLSTKGRKLDYQDGQLMFDMWKDLIEQRRGGASIDTRNILTGRRDNRKR